ncbi:TRPC5 [Branchiostoma lanceolatum]|uniref:TRPC5 protein n=1 Tax=Branchiostoma lanceolatum TaxID=7740 RepID=A0A8J9VAI5_BRALA|nr:TRPC5 [Branchiostoma lanceolatum]
MPFQVQPLEVLSRCELHDNEHRKVTETADGYRMDTMSGIHKGSSDRDPGVTVLTEAGKKLLSAAASGDIATVTELLGSGEGRVDVDCTDGLGRCAVELAVGSDHLEVADVLLHYGATPGEALLYAVDKEDVAAVEMLLNYPIKVENSPSTACSSYPPEMTPIVLASHKNSLPVLKALLNRKMSIPDPDEVPFNSHPSTEASLNLYRGLVSPYYILLTNDDPLRRTFVLSTRLDDVGANSPEVEEEFSEMAERCRQLGVDLLDQVRNRDEAGAILNYGDEVSPLIHGDNCKVKLSRLNMAVHHNQKKFVANRWSQRMVRKCWYGPHYKPTNASLAEYLRGLVVMLLTPILALVYLVAPTSRASRFIRTPAVRFAMNLTSFLTFLILVVLRSERIGFNGPPGGELAPDGTVLEWMILAWVLGMFLEETRLIWKMGARTYISDAVGKDSWFIIVIYLTAFAMRIAASITHGGPQVVFRLEWQPYDTTLIAEALTAVGGVVAFLRLLNLLTIDRFLGPMALSMASMIKDIIKFLVIFGIIVIAFSSGLNELYNFYGGAIDNMCQSPNATSPLVYTTCETKNAFGHFRGSFAELFWSLFGLGEKDTLDLSISESGNPDGRYKEHTLTMYVGLALYGLYNVVAAVVLLNMLIAMMSNSYQAIVDNETTEWRFEVTKLMLRYIRDDTTLPVPFNLIPSPKFIYNNVIKKCCLRQRFKFELVNKERAKAENDRRYKEVLSHLVRRYLLVHDRGSEPIFSSITSSGTVTAQQHAKADDTEQPKPVNEDSFSAKIVVKPAQAEDESTNM